MTTYKLKSAQNLPLHIKTPNTGAPTNNMPTPHLRCPHCMHMGAFSALLGNDYAIQHLEIRNGAPFKLGRSLIGLRACPNPQCRGLVTTIIDDKDNVTALPNEVLDFDATDIPSQIATSLEEAVKCHGAQCYKAAALMVRRVLEEMCEDRQATGNNLKDRIAALAKLIVVPAELLQAADHLRLLGNDAAHIEAKTYQSIGEQEVRLSIDLAKELLKAVYQYKGLLSRLTALQKS